LALVRADGGQLLDADRHGKTYLGMDGAIVKYSVLHPNYYMLRFWDRRRDEGTTILAEFFLNRVLHSLK
jgi:hypothetical protein